MNNPYITGIPPKPKKSNRPLIFVISLVVLALLAGAVYFVLFTGKTFTVPFTEADLASFIRKSNVKNPTLFVDALTNKKPVVKTVAVDSSFTIAEVNAIVSEGFIRSGMVKSIAIRFPDSETVEICAVVGENVEALMDLFNVPEEFRSYGEWAKGKIVYFQGSDIKYLGNNTFRGEISDCQVGQLNLDVFDDYAFRAFDQINDMLPDIAGFEMEQLSFGPEGVYFKGIVPDLG
jgi:hypothetical protein